MGPNLKHTHPARPALPLFFLRYPAVSHLTDIDCGSQRAQAVSTPDSLFIYKLPALLSSLPPSSSSSVYGITRENPSDAYKPRSVTSDRFNPLNREKYFI